MTWATFLAPGVGVHSDSWQRTKSLWRTEGGDGRSDTISSETQRRGTRRARWVSRQRGTERRPDNIDQAEKRDPASESFIIIIARVRAAIREGGRRRSRLPFSFESGLIEWLYLFYSSQSLLMSPVVAAAAAKAAAEVSAWLERMKRAGLFRSRRSVTIKRPWPSASSQSLLDRLVQQLKEIFELPPFTRTFAVLKVTVILPKPVP